MARPDLSPGYGGWQACDATPQETSDGKTTAHTLRVLGWYNLFIIYYINRLNLPCFSLLLCMKPHLCCHSGFFKICPYTSSGILFWDIEKKSFKSKKAEMNANQTRSC